MDAELRKIPARTLVAIGVVSASLLAYQILLTRVSALRLAFHFSFLAISNALLGFGASGALLAVGQDRWRQRPERWAWWLAAAYTLSLPLAWLLLGRLPVPDTLRFTATGDVVRFAAFNLAAALPFFTGGGVVGLLLSLHARRVHRLYAADLIGAALGCLLCPLLLWPLGAGGCLLLTLALAAVAFAALSPTGARQSSVVAASLLVLGCVLWAPWFDRWAPVPGKGGLDLTSKVHARIARQVLYSRWSANSRVDMLPIPANQRFMFARGRAALSLLLPEQRLIVQDGNAGTILSAFGRDGRGLEALDRSLYAMSTRLVPGGRVLVIGMGGGNDVWAAKRWHARSIEAIELNRAVVDIHQRIARPLSRGLVDDPTIHIVVDEGRSALARSTGRFDLIQMSGIDTWTALSSGAYVLAENYLYTREALGKMYAHLEPGGVLQIMRMAAEMETLRLLASLYAALGPPARARFAQSVAVMSTPDQLTAVALERGVFSPGDLAALADFARNSGITVRYLPGRPIPGRIADFILTDDKRDVIERYPRNISPTTDDRPYFFNFTRWSEPLASSRRLDEKVSVSQGNPLFLLGQLAVSTLLAGALILLPAISLRRHARRRGPRSPPYGLASVIFGALGVGYIGVEIALIQKLTLLVGTPLYSLAVTLMSLLLFTGVGSFASERWVEHRRGRTRMVATALLALLVALALVRTSMIGPLLALPLSARLLCAAIVTAPLGLLMGVPFALGIRRLARHDQALVPWAWAINGCSTVVGSVAAVIVSMIAGFTAVLLAAAGCYLLAFVALGRLAAEGNRARHRDSAAKAAA